MTITNTKPSDDSVLVPTGKPGKHLWKWIKREDLKHGEIWREDPNRTGKFKGNTNAND